MAAQPPPQPTGANKTRRASIHLQRDSKKELYANLSADEELPGSGSSPKQPALITPDQAAAMIKARATTLSPSSDSLRRGTSSDADTDHTDRDDKVPLYDDEVPITDEDAVDDGDGDGDMGTGAEDSADAADGSEDYDEQQLEVDDSDVDLDALSDENVGYDTGAAADADNDTGSLSGGTEQSISLNTEDEAAAAAAAGSGIDLYRVGVMAPEDNASDDGAPETIGITYLGPDAAAGLSHSSLLESTCAYLLDGDSRMFVWVGAQAPLEAKALAIKMAHDASADEDAITAQPPPPISEEYEGKESAEFKSLISQWRAPGSSPSPPPETSPVTVGGSLSVASSSNASRGAVPSAGITTPIPVPSPTSLADEAERERREADQVTLEVDVRALLKPVVRQAGRMFEEDNPGQGDVDVYRLDDASITPVPDSDHGLFSSCFSYLVMYTYHGQKHERTVVYFWQGKHTPHFSVLRWKYDLVPELTQGLKDERGVEPECVRLLQNHESDHFLSLFTGGRRMLVWDDHRRIKVKIPKSSSKELHKYTKVSRMLVYGSLAKAWRKQTVALDANKKVLVCAHSKDDVAKSHLGATIDLTEARFYFADYIHTHLRTQDPEAILQNPQLENAFFFEITSYGATPKTHYFGTASQREFFDWVSAFSLCGMVFAAPTADSTWLKYVVQPEIPADQLVEHPAASSLVPAAVSAGGASRTLEAAVPSGTAAAVSAPAPAPAAGLPGGRARAQSITPAAAQQIADRFGAGRRMSVSSSLLAMNGPTGGVGSPSAGAGGGPPVPRGRSGSILAIIYPTFAPLSKHRNHLRCVLSMQGFLLKKGYYQSHLMKRRFFRIGPDLANPTSGLMFLHYFVSFDDAVYKPKGSIQLTGAKIQVAKEPGQFHVEAADRSFLLQALSLEEEKYWLDTLTLLASLPEHSFLPELKVDLKNKQFLWNWNGVSWEKLAVDKMGSADPEKEKRVGEILAGKSKSSSKRANRTPRVDRSAGAAGVSSTSKPSASSSSTSTLRTSSSKSASASRSGTLTGAVSHRTSSGAPTTSSSSTRKVADVKSKVESKRTLTSAVPAAGSAAAAGKDDTVKKTKATVSMKRLNRTPRRVGPPPGLTAAPPAGAAAVPATSLSAEKKSSPTKAPTSSSAASSTQPPRSLTSGSSTLTRSSSSRSGTLTRSASSKSTTSTGSASAATATASPSKSKGTGTASPSAAAASTASMRDKVRAQVKVSRASAGLSMEDQQMLEYKDLVLHKQKNIEERETVKLAEVKPSKGTQLVAPQTVKPKSGIANKPALRVAEDRDDTDVKGLRHALAIQKQQIRRKKKMSRTFLKRRGPNKNREHELARIRAVETDRQLFRLVFQGYAELARAVEVECVPASLTSRHVFVLRYKNTFFIWRGRMVSSEYAAALSDVAGEIVARVLMLGDPKDDDGLGVVHLVEGEETSLFWDALGSKDDYTVYKVPQPTLSPADVVLSAPLASPLTVQDLDQDPPVFRCRLIRLYLSDPKSGGLKAGPPFRIDRIQRYAQSDLNDEDCFLIDLLEKVFVWMGHQSKDATRRLTKDLATRYIQAAGRKHDCPVVEVPAGSEPTAFRAVFLGWDPEQQLSLSPKRSFYPKLGSDEALALKGK